MVKIINDLFFMKEKGEYCYNKGTKMREISPTVFVDYVINETKIEILFRSMKNTNEINSLKKIR